MHERKKIAKSKMITLCSVIAVFAIVFDQLTKYAAMTRLKDGAAFVLIDNVLEFYYLVNTGSSWGMLAGQKALILFISVLTGVGGGVMRDIFAGDRPYIL